MFDANTYTFFLCRNPVQARIVFGECMPIHRLIIQDDGRPVYPQHIIARKESKALFVSPEFVCVVLDVEEDTIAPEDRTPVCIRLNDNR